MIVQNGVVLVPLPCGRNLTVDAEDADRVLKHRWHLDKDGYAITRAGGRTGKRVVLHRMLLNLTDLQLGDHKNGDRLDNTRGNLRVANRRQNGQNQGRHRDNACGYKGVHLCKTSHRWRVRVMADGVIHDLGRFQDAETAARAYDTAALRLHGPFARINFPEVAK